MGDDACSMGSSRSGRYLDQVRRIVFERLQGHAARVFLFGSRARGAAGPISDVDVAILPGSPQAAARLPAIREALEESTVPYLVDVVNLTDADPALIEAVFLEGIEWSA